MPALPPRITVITPSFNQGDLIEQTIRSVLDQDYPNLEYLIYDGGSTDGSVDVIRRFASRLDFWVSQKDRGQSHAINQGLQRATGDVVVWLNSDDFFHPGALHLVGQAYAAHPEAGLFIGNGTVVDREGRHVRRYSKSLRFSYDALLRGSNYILQPSTFIHRRVLEKEGYLDESLHYAMDLEYWLRVGHKYPVVTIDRELSAYRWYAEIKTASGGVRRWVEMWQILQRHSRLGLTPGLLVEFFNILQETKVAGDAALPGVGEFARQAFWQFYQKMQPALGLEDCIPRSGEGIEFIPSPGNGRPASPPTVPVTPSSLTTPAAPNDPAPTAAPAVITRSRPSSRPVIDVVLPEGHSWFVREGYAEALKRKGCLGRTFYVPSWKPDDTRSEALFQYLRRPESDGILLMDTLWHAQSVHATEAWRHRWADCPARKVLFSFECMSNPRLRPNPRWWNDSWTALQRAVPTVDGVVFAHEIDAELFAGFGVPALWQPFAVDEAISPEPRGFAHRRPRAFFKGKVDRFYDDDRCYQTRRRLLEYLRQQAPFVDVIDSYDDAPTGVLERNQRFLREMSEYQVVIGLPSLSPTMVVRPFEAMLAGCVFFQNQIEGERSRSLFRHGEHGLFYDENDPAGLVEGIRRILADPESGRRLAVNGRREVLERHTIAHRIAELLPWFEALRSRPVATPTESRAPEPAVDASVTLDLRTPASLPSRRTAPGQTIVIDGVIFQLQQKRAAGISRVWTNLLRELAASPLADQIVLLDRGGTAPAIPGLRQRRVPSYDAVHFEGDPQRVQRWCDEEQAGLFVSTYHTCADLMPGVVLLHDMIPEIMGLDLSLPEWRAKALAIEKAHGYLAVSRSTIDDFRKLYPQHADRPIHHAPNAADPGLAAATPAQVREFRERHQLRRRYFLLVGNRVLYKNAMLFFRAFAQRPDREDIDIVCVGGAPELEPAFRPFVRGARCRVLRVPDDQLAAAYTGAIALIYPSQYEGFGLPILEAHACGCPVITCRNSSLPEVAGEAALFVDESDVAALGEALARIESIDVRSPLIEAGRANVRRFSWPATGRVVAAALEEFLASTRSRPRPGPEAIGTVDALIALFEGADEDAREVARHLTVLTRVYRGLARYDRRFVHQVEAAAAAGLIHRHPSLRSRIAPIPECDTLLTFALGLAAEGRQDFEGAKQLHLAALQTSTDTTTFHYHFRLALRAERLAARQGDSATAARLRSQVVLPLLKAAEGKLDLAAEESLIADWRPAPLTPQRPTLDPTPSSSTPVHPAQAAAPAPISISTPNSDPVSTPVPAPAPDSPRPLVTAIVSTYAAERFLRGCLEDLLAQTIASQLEIIVVDSASPQNERAVVEEFQRHHPNLLYLRTERRETVYGAWNRALRQARGRYVTNANTDDRHRRDALEILARTLDENPGITLVYADCLVTRTENATFENPHATGRFRWLDFDPADLLLKGCFCGPQPMWRREVHEEHGYFDDTMVSAGDYEFWLRIARNRRFLHLHDTLGLYLESPESVEHRNRERAATEIAEARRRHGSVLVPGFQAAPPAVTPGAGQPSAPAQPSTPPPGRRSAPLPLPDCARLGQLGRARDALQHRRLAEAWTSTCDALRTRPYHPEAVLLLAEIALAAGHSVAASQCAERARSMAPDWKPARRLLKRLPSHRRASNHPWLIVPPELANDPVSPSRPPRLTICLIVRNEEAFLPQCLRSVRDLAHQIVVVDTGSTDRTVAIAREFGAEVHSFTWRDDFSAARNAALEHARGDWILALDADEELLPDQHSLLREALAKPGILGYRIPLENVGAEAEGDAFVPRLFRNAPGLFYVSRVHEQVFSSLLVRAEEWGLTTALGGPRLRHHGYRADLVRDRDKTRRNLQLLEQAITEMPGEPNLLMNLGLELTRSGQVEAGLARYEEAFHALEAHPTSQHIPELRETLLTQFSRHLMTAQRFADVIRVLQSPVAARHGLNASLAFTLGLALLRSRRYDEAATAFQDCLARRADPGFAPINPEIHRAGPYHCLATCFVALNRFDAAEAAFAKALEAEPGSRPVRLDLVRLRLAQRQSVESLTLLHQLVSERVDDPESWRLGGEIALANPDFLDFALDWTGEAVKHLPADPVLAAQRAEALLLSGDPAGALPFWRQTSPVANPTQQAALCLCELVTGSDRHQPTGPSLGAPAFLPTDEARVSREFLKWYQRLYQTSAAPVLLHVNDHLNELDRVLPSAARGLRAAMAEAA